MNKCIIQVYAQRDEKKAEQAAKEQLEKEKPGEKKVAEEGFRNFHHSLLR